MIRRSWRRAAGALLLAGCASAQAGPFILAGTDADEHGSFASGANQEGWLFMQRAIETIGAGVTNGQTTVFVLGSTDIAGTDDAFDAATSAFARSSLAASGWSIVYIDGPEAIASFLRSGAPGAGLIMLDSGENVAGGLSDAETAALAANASFVDRFVGAGGGLFSQANGYAWLSALLPSVRVDTVLDTGLALTAQGAAAFPGLTNADLSAGPYHSSFANTGALTVLATGIGASAGASVIVGAAGGSITAPTVAPVTPAIPEPGTWVLMLAGLVALVAVVALDARRVVRDRDNVSAAMR
jgi:hypothetical protein